MHKLLAIILASAVSLTGCFEGTGQIRLETAAANFELVKSQSEALSVPLLQAVIPFPNGQVAQIVVANPLAGQVKPIPMPDDPWARVADRGMGVLGTAVGIFLGGNASIGLVEATSEGIAKALYTAPAPTVFHANPPVVVNQPAPTIVEQPPYNEPIIVEQPPYNEPIIVEPTVVEPTVVEPNVVNQ